MFQLSKLKTVEVRDFVIIVIALLSLLLFVIILDFQEVPKMGQLTSIPNLVIIG